MDKKILELIRATLQKQKLIDDELERLRIEFDISPDDFSKLREQILGHEFASLMTEIYLNDEFNDTNLRINFLSEIFDLYFKTLMERGFTREEALALIVAYPATDPSWLSQ